MPPFRLSNKYSLREKGFSLRRSWHKSALRNRFVTDVVCGKYCVLPDTFGEFVTFQHHIRHQFANW